jgi:hypothetical protein
MMCRYFFAFPNDILKFKRKRKKKALAKLIEIDAACAELTAEMIQLKLATLPRSIDIIICISTTYI